MGEVYKVKVEEDEESCCCSGLGSRVEISGAKGRRHLGIIIEPLHLLNLPEHFGQQSTIY